MEFLKLDEKASYELIKESVRIAKRAVEVYLKENPKGKGKNNWVMIMIGGLRNVFWIVRLRGEESAENVEKIWRQEEAPKLTEISENFDKFLKIIYLILK